MARKETITKNDILDAAFDMVSEEGIKQLSARTLAARAGCSTQPIFRVYRNMEELEIDVFFKAVDFFEAFYQAFPKSNDTPFVDLGIAYIRFAQKNPHLFRLLFLSENRNGKSLYDILNGKNGAVIREINNAKIYGCKDPSGMFMKMWIFIHGAACMTLTGDYDLQEEETVALLTQSYESFLN